MEIFKIPKKPHSLTAHQQASLYIPHNPYTSDESVFPSFFSFSSEESSYLMSEVKIVKFANTSVDTVSIGLLIEL